MLETPSENQALGASSGRCEVIFAPTRRSRTRGKSVFLAGTTSPTGEADWRQVLTESLSELPITILNPFRSDWNWVEDLSDPNFREQVDWEMDMQEDADIIAIYFHPITLAPISLLELGLCARTGKAIVMCPAGPNGYKKRGNVQAVCQRFGIELVYTVDELAQAIIKRVNS